MKYSAAQLLESITVSYKDGIIRPIIMDSHKYSQSSIRAWYDLLAESTRKTHQVVPYNSYFLFECLELFYDSPEHAREIVKCPDWILPLGDYSEDHTIDQARGKQWMHSSEYNENTIKDLGAYVFLNQILRDTLQVVSDKCVSK